MKVLIVLALIASVYGDDPPVVVPVAPVAPVVVPDTKVADDIGLLAQPNKYTIELELDPESDVGGLFKGSVNVTFKANSATKFIKLNKDTSIVIVIDDIKVNGKKPSDISDESDILTITLDAELVINSVNTLEMKYMGEYFEDFGMIIGTYTQAGVKKNMIATHFHPMYAHRVFPCWDLPKFKAEFELTLSYPDKYKAISNQESIKDSTETKGMRKSMFKKTEIMAPYLLAFVVYPMDLPVKSVTKVKKYSFYGTSTITTTANTAINYAPRLMEFMEGYTNYPINLTKIDSIGTKFYPKCSMESWGLNTYEESNLFYDPTKDSSDIEIDIVRKISKMTAMNWFGDLINYASWENSWISEGLARLFEYISTYAVGDDSWDMSTQMVTNEMLKSLDLDANLDAKPLNSLPKTTEEIMDKLKDPLFYKKAPTIMAVIRHLVGTENFKRAIQNYIQTNKFKAVVPSDLFNSFSGLTGTVKTVKDVITTYIEKPGYPLLTVTVADKKVSVQQSRYLDSGEAAAADADIKYDVPITFVTKSSMKNDATETPQFWLDSKDATVITTFSGDDDWIILNQKKFGYYRVVYPTEMYTKISQAMSDNIDDFHVLTRIQYADDIVHFLQSGKLGYIDGMKYLEFISKETNPYVWQIVLNFYDVHIKSQPKELLRLALTSWFGKRMKTFLSGVSLEASPKDTISYNLRRRLAIQYSIEFGNSTSQNEINNLYSKYRKGGVVSPNLRSLVFSAAIADSSDDDDWQFLFDKLQKSESVSERKMLVDALSKSQKSILIEKLIVHLISSKPEIANALQLLKMMSGSGSSLVTRNTMISAIKMRYRMFKKRFNDNWTEILNIAVECIMDDTEKNSFVTWLKTVKVDSAVFETKYAARMKSRTATGAALKKAYCD